MTSSTQKATHMPINNWRQLFLLVSAIVVPVVIRLGGSEHIKNPPAYFVRLQGRLAEHQMGAKTPSGQALERAKLGKTMELLLAHLKELPSYLGGDCDAAEVSASEYAAQCQLIVEPTSGSIGQSLTSNSTTFLFIKCLTECKGTKIGVPGHVFHVLASGPTRVEGVVMDMGSGIYLVQLELTHPGEYTISAHIRMLTKRWVTKCSEDMKFKDAGRVWVPVINSPLIYHVSGSLPPEYESLPLCTGVDNPAQWVKVHSRDLGTHMSSVNWQWRGIHCRYKTYTPTEAKKCLQNRRLVIMGDSHSRTAYVAIENFLHGTLINDGNKFQYGFSNCSGLGVCVEFLWLPYPDDIRSGIQERIDSGEIKCDDAIITQSGQWNAAYRCIADAKQEYEDLAVLLKELSAQRFAAWVSPPASSNHIDSSTRWLNLKNSRQTSPRMNAEVRQSTAAMKRAGVAIIDLNAMTRPRLETICDGAHFACVNEESVGKVRFEGPVILSFWQVVFNGLCNTALPPREAECAAT